MSSSVADAHAARLAEATDHSVLGELQWPAPEPCPWPGPSACPVCRPPAPTTYELVEAGTAIRCLRCNLTSHNAGDVEHLYCGACGQYHLPGTPPGDTRPVDRAVRNPGEGLG